MGVGAVGPPATACPSRPHSFARYIAMSARFRRSPAVVGVAGERGDPDARAGVDVHARDRDRRRERGADALGQRDRVLDGGRAFGRLDVGEEDQELVAALTGDRVGLADGLAEPPGDGAEQLVPRRVAEVVVDELEVVEVHEEDRDVRPGPARPREGELERAR